MSGDKPNKLDLTTHCISSLVYPEYKSLPLLLFSQCPFHLECITRFNLVCTLPSYFQGIIDKSFLLTLSFCLLFLCVKGEHYILPFVYPASYKINSIKINQHDRHMCSMRTVAMYSLWARKVSRESLGRRLGGREECLVEEDCCHCLFCAGKSKFSGPRRKKQKWDSAIILCALTSYHISYVILCKFTALQNKVRHDYD